MKISLTLTKTLPWILIIGGVIGLLCSLILTADHISLLENPRETLNCDLNPVVSCGAVISSKESTILGLPNPVYGIAAFAVLITSGVVLLSGAQLKRWYWLGLQGGSVFGLISIAYLYIHSVYTIDSLCPFCMIVWAVVLVIFWYVTLYNLQAGHITTPKRLQKAQTIISKHHGDILLAMFVLLTALILQHFWYYYGQFLN